MVTKEDVLDVLKDVVDPEIGLSVVDLGLIYDVKVDGDIVNIKMTLTTPGCPLATMIARDAEMKINNMDGVKEAVIDLVFDPPWSPEMMSDKAKNMLGYG